jgi:hypothetical protein
MIAVPEPTPVTMPVELPTDATDGLLLLHIPPAGALANVMVEPIQTEEGPEIGIGSIGGSSTVITLVVLQPVGAV